jgi:hypothetical protein
VHQRLADVVRRVDDHVEEREQRVVPDLFDVGLGVLDEIHEVRSARQRPHHLPRHRVEDLHAPVVQHGQVAQRVEIHGVGEGRLRHGVERRRRLRRAERGREALACAHDLLLGVLVARRGLRRGGRGRGGRVLGRVVDDLPPAVRVDAVLPDRDGREHRCRDQDRDER